MFYNIYRFSENAPDNRIFDVRNCYENAGSVSFDMQLEGEYWCGLVGVLNTIFLWISL